MKRRRRTGSKMSNFSSVTPQTQIIWPNPFRVRFEIYMFTGSGNIIFQNTGDASANALISNGATYPIIVDEDTHGNLAQRAVYVTLTSGFFVAVLEIFTDEEPTWPE